MTKVIPPGSSTYTITTGSTIFSNAGTRGTLVGTSDGIFLNASHDTVVNSGTILGGTGAYAFGTNFGLTGNRLTNLSGGLIESAGSVDAVGFASSSVAYSAYVYNAGIINTEGGKGNGVGIFGGGTVVNTGTISGGGVYAEYGSATITNSGVILGNTVYGAVYMKKGGIVTNMFGGTIAGQSGSYGVKILGAAGTVTNAGSINGGIGDAISLSASYTTNRVILDPGAKFTGLVSGGNGATLELGTRTGISTVSTVTGLGSEYTNFKTLTFDTGAKWQVGGSASAFSAQTIVGFNNGDTLNVTGFTATSQGTFGAGSTLTMAGSGSTSSLTLKFGASVSDFVVTTGAFGTDITTMCFCPGTRIATPDGEVRVEELQVGGTVTTLGNNGTRTIKWIGHGRIFATSGQHGPATPVIVHRHALGPNVPHADLRVTKGHALYLDDVLIPVEFLVNHRSIIWDDRAREVTLYHVELDAHDVMLANGAPAESYRDDGNRWLFQNANSGWHLPPQEPYAPVLTGGPIVDAAWRRFLDRAGPRHLPPTTDDPDLHLMVDGQRIDATPRGNRTHAFRLSACPKEARIVSRDAVPAELGIARDPRSLGVALQRILLWQGAKLAAIEADDPRLTEGFHDYEPEDALRWTKGDAVLPEEVFAGFTGPVDVVLYLAGATTYWDHGDQSGREAA